MTPKDAAVLSAVLEQRPLGIALDIDGTLSPLVPTPAEATLYPGVRELLQEAQRYMHVAIITGRAVADGAPIVNVEGLTYIGTHGMEWSHGLPSTHPVHLVPEAEPYVEPGHQLLRRVQEELRALPGIVVQYKQVGGSVHYRNTADPEQARQRIMTLLEEPAREAHMRLSSGKMVIEVLPPLSINKGVALRRFVQQQALQGIIFAGDDRTDLYAMQEITQLRKEGIEGISIAVQFQDTLPAILEEADIVVREVKGMAELLREIVRRVSHT